MRVLLTGAGGFIGSHVARRLLAEEGCELVALLRPGAKLDRIANLSGRLKVVYADLFSREDAAAVVKNAAPELFLHLAWCAEPGEGLHSPKNVDFLLGGIELFRAAAAAGCKRVVMAGTSIEYGESPRPVAEDAPIKTSNLYAATKHSLFLTAREMARREGWAFASARIFNVYGPWENQDRLVPQVIRDLAAGRPCDLTDGEQLRDYLHVEDVAGGLLALARSRLEGAVNIGSGEPVKVGDVARTIGRIMGSPQLLRFGAKPSRAGDPRCLCADTTLLRASTSWRPSISLEDGLRRTVEWWRGAARPA